ncbi:hypothetical protein C8J42_10822 [Sphingomonas sp. PP-CE-1A-559]|nr:hypothetical protein C8J42_10822 [Sphingomonas sp. PP-CE-1A-559]
MATPLGEKKASEYPPEPGDWRTRTFHLHAKQGSMPRSEQHRGEVVGFIRFHELPQYGGEGGSLSLEYSGQGTAK